MAPPRSKRRRCLHLGLVRGATKGEREKPKKQREGTWNILVTESEDSVVPWNVNGTPGGEVTTNSERVIPLTFVSFSQWGSQGRAHWGTCPTNLALCSTKIASDF